jgi:hypothetical protein
VADPPISGPPGRRAAGQRAGRGAKTGDRAPMMAPRRCGGNAGQRMVRLSGVMTAAPSPVPALVSSPAAPMMRAAKR